ncbi:MAG TPA: hypothetical protein EYP14_15070 [Planctomycetaceae bacterium]|nr:hypothetical protein [Planctomycetaceae bacterium]
MSEFTCPECHATLEPDRLAQLASPECPFCGHELPERVPGALERFGETRPSTQPLASGPDAAAIAATLPPKSRIRVVEATPERLLLYIPAGSSRQTRGLGVLALFWNGFMAVYTGICVAIGGAIAPLVVLIPFSGLFWLIGLFMLGFWVRMRFSRFFVLVEPNRFTLQRVLFNRKSLQMTELGPDARAELVESYRENNVPVYAIAVTGTDRTIKFGVALTPQEKEWLSAQINRMLGKDTEEKATATCPICGATWILPARPAASVETCPDCGASIVPERSVTAETPPEVSPDDVPRESCVKMERADGDRLRLSLPLIPKPVVRGAVTVAACVFELVWCVFIVLIFWDAFARGIGFAAAFGGLMLLLGAIPAVTSLLIVRSHLTIDVTREWLACRWHAGPLGYTFRAAPETIEAITLERVERIGKTVDGRKRISGPGPLVCVLTAGGRTIPLTLGHDTATARLVGGLLRYQLRQFGFSIPPQ